MVEVKRLFGKGINKKASESPLSESGWIGRPTSQVILIGTLLIAGVAPAGYLPMRLAGTGTAHAQAVGSCGAINGAATVVFTNNLAVPNGSNFVEFFGNALVSVGSQVSANVTVPGGASVTVSELSQGINQLFNANGTLNATIQEPNSGAPVGATRLAFSIAINNVPPGATAAVDFACQEPAGGGQNSGGGNNAGQDLADVGRGEQELLNMGLLGQELANAARNATSLFQQTNDPFAAIRGIELGNLDDLNNPVANEDPPQPVGNDEPVDQVANDDATIAVNEPVVTGGLETGEEEPPVDPGVRRFLERGIENLEEEIEKLRRREAELLGQFQNGEINILEFRAQVQEVFDEIRALENNIEQIEEALLSPQQREQRARIDQLLAEQEQARQNRQNIELEREAAKAEIERLKRVDELENRIRDRAEIIERLQENQQNVALELRNNEQLRKAVDTAEFLLGIDLQVDSESNFFINIVDAALDKTVEPLVDALLSKQGTGLSGASANLQQTVETGRAILDPLDARAAQIERDLADQIAIRDALQGRLNQIENGGSFLLPLTVPAYVAEDRHPALLAMDWLSGASSSPAASPDYGQPARTKLAQASNATNRTSQAQPQYSRVISSEEAELVRKALSFSEEAKAFLERRNAVLQRVRKAILGADAALDNFDDAATSINYLIAIGLMDENPETISVKIRRLLDRHAQRVDKLRLKVRHTLQRQNSRRRSSRNRAKPARNVASVSKPHHAVADHETSGVQSYASQTRSPEAPFMAVSKKGDNGASFFIDVDEALRRRTNFNNRFAAVQGAASMNDPLARWTIDITGDFTHFKDSAATDRKGLMFTLQGRAAYQLTKRIVVGGHVTYKNGDVDSRFNQSELHAGYIGTGLFARSDIYNGLLLDAAINYEHGFNNFNLAGDVSDFGSDAFNVGARLTKRFDFVHGYWVEPNLALSYSNSRNASFTSSSGIVAPGTTFEQGRVAFGPRIGRTFRIEDNHIAGGEAYIGMNGLFDFISEADASLGNGAIASDPTNGFQLNGGFGLTWANGWHSSASASFVHLDTLNNIGGSLNISIPF